VGGAKIELGGLAKTTNVVSVALLASGC